MNKEQFLAWVENMPGDFEVEPFEYSCVKEEETPWIADWDSKGKVFDAVYKKTVRTRMKFDVSFSGEMSGEFKRDQFGHEQWVNIRRVK